ncbi:MAG: tripartite tricarboxylate transporter substrate binding protein [Rhodoferax sp.]|nr:tripartite tricarboxylate transporter substrate binding protein [Rhodoferax sp.]
MKKTIAILALCLISCVACAQDNYPSKPIRLIVPFAPGQVTDWLARFVGEQMQTELGQPVIVENRPGVNGVLGNAYAVKQPADGYTLVITSNGTHAAAPHMTKVLGYDPVNDFAHLTALMSLPWTLMVRSDFPAQNINEFIAYLKANPGKLSSGYGSQSSRLCLHLLRTMAKVDFLDVPYKSLGQTTTDVRGGVLQFNFLDIGSSMAQNGQGMRALAVTSSTRSAQLPNVPAMAEVLPNYQMTSWLGMAAPAGTPPAITRRLQQVVSKIMANPENQKKIAAYGGQVMALNGEQVVALIKAETTVWANFARDAGIQKE